MSLIIRLLAAGVTMALTALATYLHVTATPGEEKVAGLAIGAGIAAGLSYVWQAILAHINIKKVATAETLSPGITDKHEEAAVVRAASTPPKPGDVL